ncbi:MAG: hypothetical protein ACYC6Y_07595 [Thermoguttaceae bacterium]
MNTPSRLASRPFRLAPLLLVAAVAAVAARAADDLSDVPMERLVIDDMEDVADWSNGSPDETRLAASDVHVKEGKFSLEFANVVDHTKGEKNYPIGWPRTGKELKSAGLTDWTGYEYFECWIYVTTSRESLPREPLGVGFYHSGPKRSTSFPLAEIRKDAWTRIRIPISKIDPAADVQRVQFNISESNYSHGDRVQFSVDDVVLTRFAHPVIGFLAAQRRLVYTGDRRVTAEFELLGNRSGKPVDVVLEVGRGNETVATARAPAADLAGEITAELPVGDRPADRPLAPGPAWMKLTLQDASGKALHARQAIFRVIEGPF